MNLSEQFPNAIAGWVRYSQYEIKAFGNGMRVTPAPHAKAELYDPLASAGKMLAAVLNIGRLRRHDLKEVEVDLLTFVQHYGLLGLAVDLPLQPEFLSSREILLQGNSFTGLTPTMSVEQYVDAFFPEGYLPKEQDRLGELSGRSASYNSVFSGEYGERMEWMLQCFDQLHRIFESAQNAGSELLFKGRTLRYELSGGTPPMMRWVFPSLKSVLEMALAQCLTEQEPALRVCKNCGRIYYNEHARSEFCQTRCRNQYNVRAYRQRQKGEE